MKRDQFVSLLQHKRLIQSLILGGFLLVIIFAARNGKTDESNNEGFISDSPFAGCFNSINKSINISDDISLNDNLIIAVCEPYVPPVEKTELYLQYEKMGFSREKFYEDLDLLAAITMAEAGNQSELGKRLVIDTVLNRIESDSWRDDDTIWEVIVHPGQYDTYTNGAYTRVSITEDIPVLIEEEIISRTNTQVIYFKTNGYFAGVPSILKEGAHYFSGDDER